MAMRLRFGRMLIFLLIFVGIGLWISSLFFSMDYDNAILVTGNNIATIATGTGKLWDGTKEAVSGLLNIKNIAADEAALISEKTKQTIDSVAEKEKKENNENIIEIGFIGPISGDSPEGESAKTGALLAIDDINNVGGINGKKISLVMENGMCTANDSAKAFKKMTNEHNIQAILTVCNSETLSVALTTKKTVVIGVQTTSPDLQYAGDNVFSMWPSYEYQGEVLAKYAYKNKLNKTSIIFTDNDYAIAVKNAFKTKFESLGGKINEEWYYEKGIDYESKMNYNVSENRENDFIFVASQEPLKGLEKITIPLLGTPESTEINGIYARYELDESNSKVMGFDQNYTKKYGHAAPDKLIAANSYDAIKIIAEYFGSDGDNDEIEDYKNLKDYISSLKDWNGVSGTFTMDKNYPIRQLNIIKKENNSKNIVDKEESI